MKWFRLYDEIIDDPKLLSIPFEIRWFYVAILCVLNRTSRETGRLPETDTLCQFLRINEHRVEEIVDILVEKKLLQKDKYGYLCKAFASRQYRSDSSTLRTKRFRERSKVIEETVTETDINNNIIKYIIIIGLATTEQRAYALIGSLKKEHDYENIKKAITETYQRHLGGGKYSLGYVKSLLKNMKQDHVEESIFNMD